MKTTNHRTIKSITLTIEELRNMLATTAETGNTFAANQVISRKISEKTERLNRQREKRRLRNEQKKAMSEKSENLQTPAATNGSSTPKKMTIYLNKKLATALLWFHNRRDHLKINLIYLIRELSQYATGNPALTSSLATIETAVTTLLSISQQGATRAHQFLHDSGHLSQTTFTLTL